MNWLFPAFLSGAGLVALPVVLHLLRRRPQQEVIFPSLRFLGPEAVRETRRHRLRRWITLVLRCLIIALLAAAFARPFWRSAALPGSSAVVVAIDNSYSMQASGRWEATKSWISGQLAPLTSGDQAAILLMHPSPRWLVPMTDNIARVRETLADLQPGYHATKYDPALRFSSRALERVAAERHTVLWAGDDQRLGWAGVNFERGLPPGVKFTTPPPPTAVANQAAITRVAVGSGGSGSTVAVTMRLFAPATSTRTLTVSSAGKVLDTRSVDLRTDQLTTVSVPVPLEGLEYLQVAMNPDELPADDTAYLVVKGGRPLQVLLADEARPQGEADFLAHAMESVRSPLLRPIQASALPDGPWPTEAVAVLRGSAAFQRPGVDRLDEFLAGGGRAWVWVDGGTEQVAWLKRQGVDVEAAGIGEQAGHLRDLDLEHPLFELAGEKGLMGLLAVTFRSPWRLTGADMEPLANWEDGGTAIASVRVGNGAVLLCGFGATRGASTWPLDTSFVPFVHQALLSLSDSRSRGDGWVVGDSLPLPPGSGQWSALDSPRPAEVAEVRAAVAPEAPGVYQFTGAGGTTLFAVNVPTEESDLALWPRPEDVRQLESKEPARSVKAGATAVTPGARDAEQRQKLWWWVVAAVVLFALGELAIANRTAL